MNVLLKRLMAALAVISVLLVAACGTSSTSSTSNFNATTVGCDEVANQVKLVNADITTDSKNAQKAQGTPDAKSASNKKSADTDKLAKLTARQSSCKSLASTASPQTPAEKVVVVALGQQGFKAKDLKVDQPVDKKAAAKATTGPGRFTSSGYVDSAKKATTFLASGTPAAKAVVKEYVKNTGSTMAELTNPKNWVIVQFKGTAVQWNGNASFHGAITATNSSRVDPAGTVGAFYVPPRQIVAGKVTYIGVLRGACGNPQFKFPTPPGRVSTPLTPVTPVTPVTVCKAPSVLNSNGLCTKDPSRDPQSQGNVPTQVTKNYPSTDNGTEVSQPAAQPSDGGNQIPVGSQPRVTPSPAPTHTGPTAIPAPSNSPEPAPSQVQASPTATAGVPTHPPGG